MAIYALFAVIIFLEMICTAIVLFSLFRPLDRIWPPKSDRSPERILMLLLFNLSSGGIITLGVLDWNAWFVPVWVRGIGGGFWAAGMSLAIQAVTCLGTKNTTGIHSGLVIKGPYRWTRNPQYLGFMLGLIGWGLLSASPFTLIAGMGSCIPLFLIPRAEEPWLLERYGAAYADYLQQVPRFLLKL